MNKERITKERITWLQKRFREKADYYREKARRARKLKTMEEYFVLVDRYNKAASRAYAIYSSRFLSNYQDPGYRAWSSRMDYKLRLRRKAEKKEEFLNKHRFGTWYLRNSLNADYGSFTCELCKRSFYHSPSCLYKGREKIADCACGHCVNKYIFLDHGYEPFN